MRERIESLIETNEYMIEKGEEDKEGTTSIQYFFHSGTVKAFELVNEVLKEILFQDLIKKA